MGCAGRRDRVKPLANPIRLGASRGWCHGQGKRAAIPCERAHDMARLLPDGRHARSVWGSRHGDTPGNADPGVGEFGGHLPLREHTGCRGSDLDASRHAFGDATFGRHDTLPDPIRDALHDPIRDPLTI